MAVDPSRTKTLRQTFAQRLRGIWMRINAQVREDITDRDVFGIRGGTSPTANAPPERLELPSFQTDSSKIEAFKQWLRRQARRGRVDVFTRDDNQFVRSAYQRGMKNMDTALRKQDVDVPDTPGVEIAFNLPVHQEQVKNLYSRVLSEWEGVVAAVEQQVARELAEGYTQGWGMHKMARRISDRIESIGKVRAETVARTEIIRASSEGSLNRFEQYGGEEVVGEAEWLSADDDRVCPLCESLDGEIFTIPEARGKLPRHPRCRCAWAPHVSDTTQLSLPTNENQQPEGLTP